MRLKSIVYNVFLFVLFFLLPFSISGKEEPDLREAFAERFYARENWLIKKSPADFALKLAKMRQDPHRFYRATPYLFYSDMQVLNSGILKKALKYKTVIQADCHLYNFVIDARAPENAFFYLGDLDESVKAPIIFDLIRLGTSFILEVAQKPLEHLEKRRLFFLFLEAYARFLETKPEEIKKFLTNPQPLYPYLEKVPGKKTNKLLQKFLRKMVVGTKLKRNEKVLDIDPEVVESLTKKFQRRKPVPNASLARLKILDVAKLVGKGGSSIGRERFLFLAENENEKQYVILDAKEIQHSVVEKEGWAQKLDIDFRIKGNYRNANITYFVDLSVFNYAGTIFKVERAAWGHYKLDGEKFLSSVDYIEVIPHIAAALAYFHQGRNPNSSRRKVLKKFARFLQKNSQGIFEIVKKEAAWVISDFNSLKELYPEKTE
ncbi:DUF2252 family protein [Candidatus Riflebacteria bacterium]